MFASLVWSLPLALSMPLQGLPTQSTQVERNDRVRFGDRVWVVDSSGAGDVTTVQEAIDLAAASDLVIVRDRGEVYADFRIEGQAASVVGEGGTPDFGQSTTIVLGVNDGPVVLRNLGVNLDVRDVGTTVWLEETSTSTVATNGDLFVSNVAELVLTRSTIRLSDFIALLLGSGQNGATVRDSSMHAFESELYGARGKSCFNFGSVNGGAGLESLRSFVALYDCGLFGGAPGEFRDNMFNCFPGNEGLGYEGLTGSTAHELSTTFQGGTSGTLSTFLGLPRSLSAPALIEDGDLAQLTVTGPPGELVSILRSPRTEVSFAPLFYGTNLVGPNPIVTVHGNLPPSGTMTIDVALPPIGPEREFQAWTFQSLQFDAANAYLSSGSITHVIEPGLLP